MPAAAPEMFPQALRHRMPGWWWPPDVAGTLGFRHRSPRNRVMLKAKVSFLIMDRGLHSRRTIDPVHRSPALGDDSVPFTFAFSNALLLETMLSQTKTRPLCRVTR